MGNDLKVTLSLVDDFTQKLTGIETEMGAFGKQIDVIGNKFRAVGNAMMAIFAVREFEKLIKSGVEYGNAIENMSRMTSLDTEETQKLDYILKQSGSSLGAMVRPLQMLSKEAYNNSNSFKVLGIETKDQNGNLKNAGQIFEETVAKLGEIKNTTERAAIAGTLFGRSTKDVLALIGQGPEKIKRYADETEKYGLILDDKTIRQLDEAKKASVLFDESMKVFSAHIAINFTPALIELAKAGSTSAKALAGAGIYFEYIGKILNGENLVTAAKEIQIERTIAEAKETEDVNRLFLLRGETLKKIDELQLKPHYNPKELDQLKAEAKAYSDAVKEINAPKSTPTQYNQNDFKTPKESRLPNEDPIGAEKELQEQRDKIWNHNKQMTEEKFRIDKERQKVEDDADEKEYLHSLEILKINKELALSTKDTYDSEVASVNEYYRHLEAIGADHEAAETARQKRLKELKIASSGAYAIQAIGDLETIAKASKADAQVQKDLAYGMAIVNTALGVTKTLSAYPMPYAAILAALDVAAGAAEIATISGQQFAVGTPYAGGGMAMVGERGPERVVLPRGSQVQTAGQTAAQVGGSSGEVHIHIHDANGNVLEAATQQLRSRSTADRFVSMVFSHANKMGIN